MPNSNDWRRSGEAAAVGFAHPRRHAKRPSHNESADAVTERKPSETMRSEFTSFVRKDSSVLGVDRFDYRQ
jgi:hypothetical protein